MRGGSRTCLIQNVFFLEDLQSILLYCVAAQDPFALYYYGKQVCIPPSGYSCLYWSNLPGCGGQMVIDYCQELLNWLVFLQIEKKKKFALAFSLLLATYWWSPKKCDIVLYNLETERAQK